MKYYFWAKSGAFVQGSGHPAVPDPYLTQFLHTDPDCITIPYASDGGEYRIDNNTNNCQSCIGYPFNCPQNYDVNYPLNANDIQYIITSNTISAQDIMVAPSELRLSAKNFIGLQEGFSAELGTHLEIDTQGCN